MLKAFITSGVMTFRGFCKNLFRHMIREYHKYCLMSKKSNALLNYFHKSTFESDVHSSKSYKTIKKDTNTK